MGLAFRRILGYFAAAASISHTAAASSNSGWAFQPLTRVSPAVANRLSSNPIDAFIDAKLAKSGLSPAPRANAATLLRRVTFDLTGLPPTPDQIEEFKTLDRDNYGRLLEQLLESPQYAERWARHWLDLVRYADTGGFEKDLLYPKAWHYRDYVIRAFDSGKPIDRFIMEQVAGDELFPDDPQVVIATGLYAIGPASADSALNSTQLEYEWLTDTVDTTGAVFLGLTLGCARCHDHKYDPLTQADYFAMQGIFAASDRPFPIEIRDNRIKGLNGILADVPIPKDLLQDSR